MRNNHIGKEKTFKRDKRTRCESLDALVIKSLSFVTQTGWKIRFRELESRLDFLRTQSLA